MPDQYTINNNSGDPVTIRKRKQPQDNRIERQIITGMIISDRFIREIQPMLKNINQFQSSYAGKVAHWCQDYYKRYNKAPNRDIEDLYIVHQQDLDEGESKLIENFLSSLSEEYEREQTFNVDYVLDKAERHFRFCSLKALNEELQRCVKGNRLDDAESLVKEYQRPERPKMKGVDPLRDKDFIMESLKPDDENPDIIMMLPGALGQACGPLERGFFIAIQAESGVGKTWILKWLGLLGCIQFGLNTAFFSLEMSERKMGKRIWMDISGSPSKGDGKIKIPVFDCVMNQAGDCRKPERKGKGFIRDGKPSPEYKPCDACRKNWTAEQMTTWFKAEDRELLNPAIAIKKQEAMFRSGLLKKAGKSHLAEFPANSLTVSEMISYLNNLEYYDDFILDFLITDYADKFKWGIANDPRNSIGQIWSTHKGIAQEKHCLVATGSQSNTERTGKRVGRKSWAENIEKVRMLDLGLAANQKDEDYEKGILYLDIDKIRDGEKQVSSSVAVLHNLAIGRPYIDSCFVRKVKKN